MGKADEKCIFWEGLTNSIFKMAKKTIFSVTKPRCLGEKKGVQFAWAKSKKRRLAWMARSLMAAGLDVKFPDEE